MRVTREVKFQGQIFSVKRIYSLFFCILLSGMLFLASCTKINEFTIGENFIESRTRLQIIDTFRIDLSTVWLDSVVTSGTKAGLAGHYSDDIFGSVKCDAFFDLAFSNFDALDDGAVYDSASFIFPYSGYYYGDTTSLMSLDLYQLTEQIFPNNDGKLYNTSTFNHAASPLGSVQFYPSPHSKADSAINIPVNSFGEELFTLIRNKDERVSTQEAFNDFLKGFVLSSSSDINNAVFGFSADKDHTLLKFYYHIDKEVPEYNSVNLTINETNDQFNKVTTDFSNTLLKDLGPDHRILKDSETNGRVFVQGMTELMAKVQFPTVQDLLMEPRWEILKAQLIFEPVRNSDEMFKLPQKLYLFETDRENRTNALLRDSEGLALLPEFVYDEIFHTDTRYTFDITSFINQELADRYFDYEHGLLIGLEQDRYLATLISSSLERLLIEDRNPHVKLRIYYLTY